MVSFYLNQLQKQTDMVLHYFLVIMVIEILAQHTEVSKDPKEKLEDKKDPEHKKDQENKKDPEHKKDAKNKYILIFL